MFSRIINKYFNHRYHQVENEILQFEYFQATTLANIINSNLRSKFLSDRKINDLSAFQNFCPILTYDELEKEILDIKDRQMNHLTSSKIIAFSKSSGTTNSSKFIPYTIDSLRYNYKASKDMLALFMHSNPNSKILGGKNFSLTGTYSKVNGFVIGDVSALFSYYLKPCYKPFRTPSLDIATMPDWEQKLQKFCEILPYQDVRWIAGVPSWIKVVIDRIENHTQKSIRTLWKNVEVFFYGGVSIEPFQEYFEAKFGPELIYWQTYNASEGFFGLQQANDQSDLLLLPNNGNYYEFIHKLEMTDEKPPFTSIENLRKGEHYELVITNFSGLYRYRMGDLIEIKELNPLKIKIVGRTKSFINMFGEELMVHNTERAVSVFNLNSEYKIMEYTVAPKLLANGKGHHEWLIEFDKTPNDINLIEISLDNELRRVNSDYHAKRENDYVMEYLKIKTVPPGSFRVWLLHNNRLNVQSKIPKLWKNGDIQKSVLSYIS
jgi:phenylacetate-coenzyme A ligase PaaK-like adenylate-forming protein